MLGDGSAKGRAESTPFRFDYVPIAIAVSVGEEITPEELTERADGHLFEAKRRGGTKWLDKPAFSVQRSVFGNAGMRRVGTENL